MKRQFPMRVLGIIAICLTAPYLYAQSHPKAITIQRDMPYRQVADQTLRFDLARPTEVVGKRTLIICIHGGGWTEGSRQSLVPVIQHLAENGFVAATISYRLSPKHRFPAHIEDAKAAVRFFRAHAERFGIYPDRIGAMGFSSGGHLALMLGLLNPDDGLEGKGRYPDRSSKVQAVVNFFGPVDMRTWRVNAETQTIIRRSYDGKSFEQVLAGVFGLYDTNDPVMKIASPIHYVDANDPPVLTLHGTADTQVPYSQAVALHEALETAGVRHQLITMEGKGHGWRGESLNRLLDAATGFLTRELGSQNETTKAAAPGVDCDRTRCQPNRISGGFDSEAQHPEKSRSIVGRLVD